MTGDLQAVARPAATLVLIRDGAAGLEVLMVARHDASGFAAGAFVFPGGRVDPGDGTLAAHCVGVGHLSASDAAARIAAIRETWEECRLLLARRKGVDALVSAEDFDRLRLRHDVGLGEVLAGGEVVLAGDLLVPFAHWVTPSDRPRRFDTLFFLAPFASDQLPHHDGREAVAARWVRPSAMIEQASTGEAKLVFATRMNLQRVADSPSVDAALVAARGRRIVTVTPEIVETASGTVFRIPAEAGYGVTEVSAAGIPRA